MRPIDQRRSPTTTANSALCEAERTKGIKTTSEQKRSNSAHLRAASRQGDLPQVLSLLPISDATIRNQMGETALWLAAESGHAAIVKALIPSCDPAAPSKNGRTALFVAAENGHLDCVNVLLTARGPLQLTFKQWSLLSAAIKSGNAALVERLVPLFKGSEFEKTRNSALRYAARSNADCFDLILPFGDPNERDDHGRNALMHAACAARPDNLRVLLCATSASARDINMESALHCACAPSEQFRRPTTDEIARRAACARMILSIAPELAVAHDRWGFTPLMLAALHGMPEVVSALLPFSNVDDGGARGRSASQVAMWQDRDFIANQRGAAPHDLGPRIAAQIESHKEALSLSKWLDRSKPASELSRRSLSL